MLTYLQGYQILNQRHFTTFYTKVFYIMSKSVLFLEEVFCFINNEIPITIYSSESELLKAHLPHYYHQKVLFQASILVFHRSGKLLIRFEQS